MSPLAHRAEHSAILLVALGSALFVGLVPGAISVLAALLAGGLLLALLLVVTLRRSVAREPMPESAESRFESDADAPAEGRSSRFARALFYFGTATLAWASLRPGLGLTVSELSFIAAFAASAFAVLRGARLAVLPLPVLVAALIFAFGGMISSVGATSPINSTIEVIQGLYVIVIWAWTGAMVLQTQRQFTTAMVIWVASAAFCGFAAVTQVMGIEALTGPPDGQRMTGLMPHPNDLGGAMAIALVPALLVANSPAVRPSALTAMIRWVPAALIATGLLLSASVGGMAAAAAGLVIWVGAPPVARSGRLAVAALAILAIGVSTVASGRVTSPVERLQQVTSPRLRPQSGSGEERISIAETAWPRILDNPVVGRGLDAEGSAATITGRRGPIEQQIHGLPLAAWYTAGIFGLIGLMMFFCVLGLSTLRNIRRAANSRDVLLGWALLGTATSFLVYSLNGPMSFQEYAWIAMVLPVVWSMRVRAAEASSAEASTEAPNMEPGGRSPPAVRERYSLAPGGALPRGG